MDLVFFTFVTHNLGYSVFRHESPFECRNLCVSRFVLSQFYEFTSLVEF